MSAAQARYAAALEALRSSVRARFGRTVADEIDALLEQAQGTVGTGDQAGHTFIMMAVRGRLRRAVAERRDSAGADSAEAVE